MLCSNYLSLEPGNRELHGGIPGHAYNPGWQIFPIFTNAFFLVRCLGSDSSSRSCNSSCCSSSCSSSSSSSSGMHVLFLWSIACLDYQCMHLQAMLQSRMPTSDIRNQPMVLSICVTTIVCLPVRSSILYCFCNFCWLCKTWHATCLKAYVGLSAIQNTLCTCKQSKICRYAGRYSG